MSEAFITVRYSCPTCGVKQREVQVKARGAENVIEWMEETCIQAVSEDHRKASPLCQARSLADLMIPISGTDKVGGVVRQ